MAITAQCADCKEGLVNFDWSPRATAMDWGEDWCLGSLDFGARQTRVICINASWVRGVGCPSAGADYAHIHY